MSGLSLSVTGKVHGPLQKTATGYIQRVLTDTSLITVYSKDPLSFQPDSDGYVNIPVNAKDNFVFAAS